MDLRGILGVEFSASHINDRPGCGPHLSNGQISLKMEWNDFAQMNVFLYRQTILWKLPGCKCPLGNAIINDYLLKIIMSNATDPYAPIYILLQFYFECILKFSCIPSHNGEIQQK